jgi:hypothetical protein
VIAEEAAQGGSTLQCLEGGQALQGERAGGHLPEETAEGGRGQKTNGSKNLCKENDAANKEGTAVDQERDRGFAGKD